ncbi:hypothetical protein BD289DRAFT_362898 [Coniella lustricola]|uniref:Methyltransferase type 11 domain-containing protein n=1 Tax=Coniella lustricola TaxID=2025994 RepID=A0A2T3AG90_9PEZI|nr:hypothetical protein BD289DRAFT_362898 [Coniella lustricola]
MEPATTSLTPLSRRARKAAESVHLAVADQQAPQITSKIPQTSSRRAPVQPQSYAWKQPSLQAPRPTNATTRDVAGKAATPPITASANPSTRPQDSARQARNQLRRKQPTVTEQAAGRTFHARSSSLRTGSLSSSGPSSASNSLDVSRDGSIDRGLAESPVSIQVAHQVELPTTNAQHVTIYPELDRYRDFQPQVTISKPHFEVPYPLMTDLPPPTPLFSNTTPTSMSSVSPGFTAPIKRSISRPRQVSPLETRPPVTRRRAGSSTYDVNEPCTDRDGLAAVRESSNSSSSGSTIRAAVFSSQQLNKQIPRNTLVSPPRKLVEQYRSRDQDAEIVSARTIPGPSQPIPAASPVSPPDAVPRSSWETTNTPLSRVTPPIRPSREGTLDLHSQVGLPTPVVHSNLSSTSLAERRRSGQNLQPSLIRTQAPSQPGHSRNASVTRIGREPTPAPTAPASVSDSHLAKQVSRGTARTPSPSVASTFKTRFPLFSRRSKTNAPIEKEKQPRKGPAAGTGHEGYGRLGQIRRRSSNLTGTLRAMPGTMSSQESLASTLPSDPFLAERMSPVVIAGGEIIHNRNMSSDFGRSDSNLSMGMSQSSMPGSKNNSEISLTSHGTRNGLGPSAMPREASITPSQARHRRLISDSSDSDVLTMKPTLAARRSMQRLKTSDLADARVPKPLTLPRATVTPSITSYDTTILSDGSTFKPRPLMALANTDISAPKKLVKKAKAPRKWNIFGRSSESNSSKKKQVEASEVSASVKVVAKEPMAFYTMLDPSEQNEGAFADVEDVLREAQVSRPSSPAPDPVPEPRTSNEEGRPAVSLIQQEEPRLRKNIVQPEPPKTLQAPRRIATSNLPRNHPEPASQPSRIRPSITTSKPPSVRPSRLPQVGRIPKVTGRFEPPPPSPRSFSRPFNRNSLQLQSPVDAQKPTEEPAVQEPRPVEPVRAVEVSVPAVPQVLTTHEEVAPAHEVVESVPDEPVISQKEFMVFPPRKSSGATSTTDSSCSGKLSYSEATAVIPEPNAPLADDEVWDEYNDLLGEDVSRGHPSTSSSLGVPFHLEVWGRRLGKASGQPMETPIINGNMGAQMNAHVDAIESECETEFEFEPDEEAQQEEEAAAQTASSAYSSGITAKINEVIEAVEAPRQAVPESLLSKRESVPSMLSLRNSQASSSTQSSDDNSTTAQVNLRVGSMTVSKWLTFGHVLFSPVRDELMPVDGSLKRHSILVIDGLGNDDWSFYAAETYPAATFFNLSPRAPLPSPDSDSRSSFPSSPPNHHQIQYKSHVQKLPFGPQSFACVVFRFPAAAPEMHYRNIINEARRVLKPGGFIELSILDVDMNNMGNHTRRAIRKLKERTHIRAPDMHLGSSSDLILRLLGRKGFSDIKTCRVGVPLATTPAASLANKADTSSSSSSRAGSSAPTQQTSRKRTKRETRSLVEMMESKGPQADEGITKMVGKVGRWWYERCYESVAPEGRGKSMWADQALLAECEEWQTSLKLMVCHARVPDGKSRIASI